jgi:anti-anti-sigma regulatory factor
MLRITRHLEQARLEGRLTRREVDLVREVFRSPTDVAVVDLTSLAYVDEVGAAALKDLERRGLEIRGGSPFVRQLLEEVAS